MLASYFEQQQKQTTETILFRQIYKKKNSIEVINLIWQKSQLRIVRNLNKLSRQMWMLCRLVLWTQMVELNRELTLKCKLKCYVKPMKDPMAFALVKGIREPHEVKKKFYWPRCESNPLCDLRIRSILNLPTELRGRTESRGRKESIASNWYMHLAFERISMTRNSDK